MRPHLQRLLRIEQYLRGPRTPEQATEWQVQCLLDPELEADTTAQQALYQGLHAAGQRQLRRELNAIHEELYGPPAGWVAALRQRLGGWLPLGPASN